MPRPRGSKQAGKSNGVVQPANEQEESLLSWLEIYHGFINDTADLLKDEFENIKKRKIERNESILRNEKKPETVRLSKNIVTSFNDAISKAVKDLQNYGVQMSEELQKRYNLPDDWMQSGSTTVSVTGSEVNGPTTMLKKREMENRLGFMFANGSAKGEVDKSLQKELDSDSKVGATESEHDNSSNESFDEDISKSIPKKKISPEKVAQISDSADTDGDNRNDEEDVDMIPATDEEENLDDTKRPSSASSSKSDDNRITRLRSERGVLETPKKKFAESSGGSSKKKATPRKDSPVQSPVIDDPEAESDESGATCIVPKLKNPSPVKKPKMIEIKKERKSEAFTNSEVEIPSTTGNKDDQPGVPVPDNNADEDDIMDFLTPPSGSPIHEFGALQDEVMTVVMPKTSLGSMERDIKPVQEQSHLEETEERVTKKEVDEPQRVENHQIAKNHKSKESPVKKSKEEIAAMKALLDSSSSDSEFETRKKTSKKSPRKRVPMDEPARNQEEKSTLSPAKKSDKSWKDDPKLKPDVKPVVLLERLAPAIVKSVNEDGFVELKQYGKLKKWTLTQLEKFDERDSSDSDSSTASNDSLKALEKELEKLTKNSIISTIKHRKRNKTDGNRKTLQKTTRKSKGRNEATDNELESSVSDASSDVFVEKCNVKPALKLADDSDIVSCSASEDLDPDSDDSSKNKTKQKSARSNSSRNDDGKKKTYKQPTLSGSDSEKEHMKAVLGSDSDSDKKTKRSKKAGGSSDTDSDFISTKKKATKRVVKGSDSDSVVTVNSHDSDSDSDFVKPKKSSKRRRNSSSESKKRKKRRKRIVTNDSDDSSKSASSGSDIEEIPQEPGSSQKGRKKIRKIMSTKAVSKTTKEAEKEEEERRKRLTDKQKMFNGIHKAPESDKIERLILDVDPETKEPVVEVESSIVGHLKPHQAEGVKFMYNACFESVDMIKQNKVPGGCILAHCMGLGKTLQTIAFVHTLLTNELCGIKTALVICPLSTVGNWFLEFKKWTEDAESIKIHKLYEAKNTAVSRRDYFKTWQRRGGVGLLHYDMFRRLADPKGKAKMKSSLKADIQEALLDPGPDIVICDEGHLLKNCKSMLSLAVSNIRTHRRIVLTGTPLQNNLVEYHTMMNFVKPNLLGSLPEFTNRFVNPIKNGQHADSTEYDVKTMKRRAHVLHRKLEGCVQRRDYSILAPYLPPKYEYIINIKLSDKQEALYKHYLGNVVDSDLTARRRNLLKYYAELVKVWSHPIALTMRRSKEESSDEDSGSSLKDFIVDKSSSSENESGEEGSGDGKNTKTSNVKKRTTRAQAANDPDWEKGIINLVDAEAAGGWWNAVFNNRQEMRDVTISGKLIILQEILKTCEAIGDKVLVFSQFLTSLDIIEEFLKDWDDEALKQLKESDQITFPLTCGPQQGRWRKNIEYFRIDGQTNAEDRQRDCDKFNKKSSLSKAKLFLISTRAGGLGINLFGANRVVIFDASWNPSQDMQSIFRVYRFGQEKPCYIYRLIARGTMEEKILRRQITKLSLSSRVVDEHQIERHLKFDDVNEMYRYDEEDPSTKDTVLAVPKDRLLADLLMSHRAWIRGYEEFDSLLENKPDEGLSNEEKELAWTEYRIESERQRQTNLPTSTSSVTSEAETYLKVKARLVTNHPNATEEQIDEATKLCLTVIDKIRVQVHILNTSPQLGPYVEPQLLPLKAWLQSAVNPNTQPAIAPVPPNQSILPALPQAFFQPNPAPVPSFQQYVPRLPMQQFPRYSQPVRPPMPRHMPHLIRADPGRPVHLVQSNLRNIASNTLGSRNYQ